MSTRVAIRAATAADAPVILDFIRRLAEYEHLSHECVATTDALTATLFGASPAAETLIAAVDGTDAGFALFFPTYSTFLAKPGLYLEDLFVLPALRGRGVGKALLAEIARRAVERGCGRLEWSVLDWNEPALRFYRSLGAQPMTEWTVQRMTGEALARLAGAGAAVEQIP